MDSTGRTFERIVAAEWPEQPTRRRQLLLMTRDAAAVFGVLLLLALGATIAVLGCSTLWTLITQAAR